MKLCKYGIIGLLFLPPAQVAIAAENAQCAPAVRQAAEEAARDFQRLSREGRLVGASLLISVEGIPCAASQYGHADLETDREVDVDTIFHWASNTKMLMAVAAMQLRDRGLIGLEDSVVDYLPEAKHIHNPYGDHRQITLRDLLAHSSGLRSPTFPWRGDNDWAPHEPAEWSQVAAMMPYTQVEFEPGTRASYSNLATSMMGRVIEVVTGDDIEVYMTKNIFMPLGMTRSYFDITPYYLIGDRSNNYFVGDGEPRAQGLDFDTGATVANGGLNAPLADIAKWTDFLLGVGDTTHHEVVLGRGTLQEMWQPRLRIRTSAGEEWDMGYVFFSRGDLLEGHRVIGHTGGQKAFVSFVHVVPELGMAAIYASNSRHLDPESMRRSFAGTRDIVLQRVAKAIEGEGASPQATRADAARQENAHGNP